MAAARLFSLQDAHTTASRDWILHLEPQNAVPNQKVFPMNRLTMLSLCIAPFAVGFLLSCSESSNPETSTVEDIALDTNAYGMPWNTEITYRAMQDSRDGQVYRTVKIGTQTWMAQNLNLATDSSWCYANSADSCRKYGRLYQWSAAMGLSAGSNAAAWNGTLPRQGVCPVGWHLPSDQEWSTLVNAVDSATSSTKLKCTSGWWTDGGTDQYGFRALPGGNRDSEGMFYTQGVFGHFWSSSENDALSANLRYISYANPDVYFNTAEKTKALSVRCLKD